MTRKTISNRRELLTDIEKGMILAFFYTLQSVCLVASLVRIIHRPLINTSSAAALLPLLSVTGALCLPTFQCVMSRPE
jgi:hypothetical protein